MANTFALLVSPGGVALSVSPGGVDFFYTPGAEDSTAVVVSHRRKKFFTREGDNLNIYRHKEDALASIKPANQPKIKGRKPAPEPVEQAEPEQVIPLAQIEALAKQYDEQQAYRQALENRQYAMLVAMFERLQDEQDVELLLMYA